MSKGKHATRSSGSFYRDLIIMTVGILLVGAAVFLLLYIIAGRSAPSSSSTTTTTQTATSTTAATTTTSEAVTTTRPPGSTTSTVPLRPAAEVRVVVYNSLTVAGAAGRLSQTLSDAGYQTLPPDDYDPELDPSRIWYREGFSAEANQLLEFVPDALVEPLPDDGVGEGADLVVVIGTGFEE